MHGYEFYKLRLTYPDRESYSEPINIEVQATNELSLSKGWHGGRVHENVIILENYSGFLGLPRDFALELPLSDVKVNLTGSIASPANISTCGDVNLYIPSDSNLKLIARCNPKEYGLLRINNQIIKQGYYAIEKADIGATLHEMYSEMSDRFPEPEVHMDKKGITARFDNTFVSFTPLEACIMDNMINIYDDGGAMNIFYPQKNKLEYEKSFGGKFDMYFNAAKKYFRMNTKKKSIV